MSCNLLSQKDPSENVVVTFDFSPALVDGEMIDAIVSVTVEVSAGEDASPEDILNGTALVTIDGLAVQQPVTGGLDGVNYSIKALCDTTNPEKRLAVTAILPVRTQ